MAEISLNVSSDLGKKTPPPVPENRSTKKVKLRASESENLVQSSISFRDCLLRDREVVENGLSVAVREGDGMDTDVGEPSMQSNSTLNIDSMNFEEGDVQVDTSRAYPKIKLSGKVKEALCNPWKNAVVVRLLGRNVGYNVPCSRIQALWKPAGGYKVIDLPNN